MSRLNGLCLCWPAVATLPALAAHDTTAAPKQARSLNWPGFQRYLLPQALLAEQAHAGVDRAEELTMGQSRPKVVVVGGGIGGLFAANALIARGLPVSVHEQAPALGEIGAGVFLTPNSVRHLQRVGLGTAVEKRGARVGPGSHYFRHDGAPIAPVAVTDSSGWNATFGMHRTDYVDLLADALPAGVVHTGHRCTGFAQDGDVARVSFANGAVAEGDVVIGADGIHSELRPFVFPPSTPVFSGSVAYRGTVPHERVPHWPTNAWLMWLGKGKHFLAFPLRAGKLINYVGFVPADEEMKESWSAPGDPDMLRQEFAGWDPRIAGLLQQVRMTFRWALYDREPLPTWTKGRLSLLGDAAHPMLPHLGQGANQAIEDGMALATILAAVDNATVPAALMAYEGLRRERVAQIQLGARQNGLRLDAVAADLAVRDAELAAHAKFRENLYTYDVVASAHEAAHSLVGPDC
jgi:salicylate hydroxylase